jgi:hypothetical protein
MDMVTALQQFHAGQLEPASLLRLVLRHERWWVPLGPGGEPELRSNGPQQFFAVYADEIEGPSRSLTGRELVGAVPAGAGGVVLEPDEDHAVAFDAGRLPDLQRWARALEVEEALSRPGPGQRELLLGAQWLILRGQGGAPATVRRGDLLLVPLFTAEDAVARFLATEPALQKQVELGRLAGEALMRALTRTEADGLAFDPGFVSPGFVEPLPVGPSYAGQLLAGLDSRPGADVLPARTVAEVHLWLDLLSVPRAERRHVIEQRPTGLCAVYDVPLAGRRVHVAFELGKPTRDVEDLGDGPSKILCAGLLSDALRTRMLGLPSDPAAATAQDRAAATSASRWAWELEKLLEGEALPRSAVHTALGARLLRERPELATRASVIAQRQRAEALAGTV